MKMPTALDEHFSGTNALFMAVPGLIDMVTGPGPCFPGIKSFCCQDC